MAKKILFDAQQLEAIAHALVEGDGGLTHSEVTHLFTSCKLTDIDSSLSKWRRVYNAFVEFQNRKRVSSNIVAFIKAAMNPISFTSRPDIFKKRRVELNKILHQIGIELGEDGTIRSTTKSNTLDDALKRANQLSTILRSRNVHEDVLIHCNAEVLQENYFHAVLEAMKSITVKVRKKSGLDNDGVRLIESSFALENRDGKPHKPVLCINDLSTKSLKGEQRGFVSLVSGLYGTIRNPLAHEAKIEWQGMDEQDAIDILTMISFVHRKIDKASPYNV